MEHDKYKKSIEILVKVIGAADQRGYPYSTQQAIADEMGVQQNYVSRLIKAAKGRDLIAIDGKFYRLSSSVHHEKQHSELEKNFALFKSDLCEISPFTFAVKTDMLQYNTIRDAVMGFFGDDCFGIFAAEKMMILILRSTCDKKLIDDFKNIVLQHDIQ